VSRGISLGTRRNHTVSTAPDDTVPHGDPAPRTAYVVLAGGSGSRVGAERNKAFLPLAGRHVVSWSLLWASRVPSVSVLLLVTREVDRVLAREVLAKDLPGIPVEVIAGGSTRHGSECAALDHLAPLVFSGTIDLIAFHDAARPLAVPSVVSGVLEAAARLGSAVPALPSPALVPVVDDQASAPVVLGDHVCVQTPQAFRARDLVAAFDAAREAGFAGTDTAGTMEIFSSGPVRVMPGTRTNIKITFSWDVPAAERLVEQVIRR
jgi:2-C-methyl-D-erythritol 4-phosphate cytidylyltransferase